MTANSPRAFDERAIRSHRQSRIQLQLDEHDVAALVLFDPVNIRYATGTRNMQAWTMHNYCRYCFIASGGPVVMFELSSAQHLCRELDGVDELRPAVAAHYMMVGPRVGEMSQRWAAEIEDLMQNYAGTDGRLAVDRLDVSTLQSLQSLGIPLADGKKIMELARSIKSLEEISAFQLSLKTCDQAVAAMRAAVAPGMRECEALAILLKESIVRRRDC